VAIRIAITVIAVGLVLVAYAVLEVRVNQRVCSACGFKVSKDYAGECPRCDLTIKPQKRRWLRSAILALGALVVAGGAAILIDWPRTETDKAVRMVRESSSRIENFTIQQYLYTTVYKRKDDGEAIEIDGWRAEQPGGPHAAVTVEFNFSDVSGTHTAVWEVDTGLGRVEPKNQTARDMSWNH